MSHRHGKKSHDRHTSHERGHKKDSQPRRESGEERTKPVLEIVLRADSAGSEEAAAAALEHVSVPDVDIAVISRGVGDISESDILMAETAGHLIAGFQVGVLPGVERHLKEHTVEARLYAVIYKMTEDIRAMAGSLAPVREQEKIVGSAQVIALFKSSRKGIIIGCEVQEGFLATGQTFRIISAMGPVYTGRIESLHIEKNVVSKAVPQQQVGIKIHDFNKVRVGDLVESFHPLTDGRRRPWKPSGNIIHI